MADKKTEIIANEILVKFDNETAKSLQQSAFRKPRLSISDVSENTKIKSLFLSTNAREISSVRKLSSSDVSQPNLKAVDRWFVVRLNGDSKKVDVDSSDANLLKQKISSIKNLPGIESVHLNYVVYVEFTPNDTYYSSNQYAPNLISADEAWDLTTGSSSVKIAILDTGIYTHSDLSSNIDSTYAADFTSSSNGVNDVHGHGTHVAGIAGAVINNSTGVAGIAGNSKLMRVKVLGDGGTGSVSTVASGIEYAADSGAKVINMSLGANIDCVAEGAGEAEVQALIDAIDYAFNTKDVVLVAAAGNDGLNDVHFPANCANVISVGAVDSSDAKASFSNYGTAVDITAPGVLIYSTTTGGSYVNQSGTSMATPQVAGVVALIRSFHTSYTAAQTVSALTNYADQISGTGTYWSNGRVNAYRSVIGKPTAPTLSIASNGCGNGTPEVAISWDPIPGVNNDVTGYNIYRKYGAGSYSYLGTVSGIPNVGFVDTNAFGIVPSSNSDYKVTAVNVNGESADSNVVNLTTQSCSGSSQLPAPTGLNVTANYCSSGDPIVTLGWNSVSGASSYLVYRRYDFQSTYYYLGATNSTSFNDYTGTGIVEGGNAYYRVMSNNGGGQSGYSSTYFATSQNCP